jgi:uncharacterized protein
MNLEELPASFWQGVQEFQSGQFYECHDTLEALWIEAQEPNKTFFQGILQIAVACYHLGNQNWRGAVILLGEGIRRLSPYQPDYGSIDINFFLDTSSALLSHLQIAGAERVADYSAMVQRYGSESFEASAEAEILPRLRQVADPQNH